MGERTNGLSTIPAHEQIAGDIHAVRDELGDMVSELYRRGHAALDLPLQMRRHPVTVAVAGAGVAAVLAAVIGSWVWSRRRRRRPGQRVRRMRRAVGHLLEGSAGEPGLGAKIAVAAGSAVASLLVNGILERLGRPWQARPPPEQSNGVHGGVRAPTAAGT